jgi:hypothetical protein
LLLGAAGALIGAVGLLLTMIDGGGSVLFSAILLVGLVLLIVELVRRSRA